MNRCFLGFELSEKCRVDLESWLRPIFKRMQEELNWQVKKVLPMNWHATLLFFPKLKPEAREIAWNQVVSWTEKKVWNVEDFQWRGLEIWPSAANPKLICLGGDIFKSSQLWPLASSLKAFPFQAGHGEPVLSYRPHITLSRFPRGRKRIEEIAWRQFISLHTPLPKNLIQLDRISFFISKRTVQNPVYMRERTICL